MNSSNNSDDSDDESDIGEMFKEAAKQNRQRSDSHHAGADAEGSSSDGSDDDDSDDFMDDAMDVQLLRSTRRRTSSKSAYNSVDVKFQKMAQSKAVRERRHRLLEAKRRRNADDDSEDDDDNDDEIRVVQDPHHRHNRTNSARETRAASAAAARNAADDDKDESSDEDSYQGGAHSTRNPSLLPAGAAAGRRRMGRRAGAACSSLQDLQQRGIALKPQDASELQKLHNAKAQLENLTNCGGGGAASAASSSAHHHHHSSTAGVADLDDDDEVQFLEISAAPQTLHLTVQATVCHKKNCAQHPPIEQVTTVSVPETENVQVVIDQALQQWQYPKDSLAVLSYNGETLKNRLALAIYGIPAVGAVVRAEITLLDLARGSGGDGAHHAAAAAQKKQRLAALPPADAGPCISLTLRRAADPSGDNNSHSTTKTVDVVLKVGLKEKLSALVQRYNDQQNVKVRQLKFDGDVLNLHSTPESNDMEDEDMVDVVV